MAGLIGSFDWSSTPLGAKETWPLSLRTAVEMILGLPRPATIVWGKDHIQIYNDSYIEIAKDRHPGLLGRPAAQNWPEAFNDVLAPRFATVFAGGAIQDSELCVPLLAPNGEFEERAFETSWSPIRDESGAVAGALEILTEVTDRRRAQVARQESEARLRHILNSMSEGFALLAPDFTILDINEKTLSLDLRTREALIGQSHWQAFPGTEDSPVGDLVRTAMRQRSAEALEHQYVWPGGRSLWLDMRVYPTSEGGVAIYWRDITDHRRADQALRESEERHRAILESVRDYAIFTTDAEGRIETWPPGAQTVFGWTADDAVGQPAAITFTHEDRAVGVPDAERAMARDEGFAPNGRWHTRRNGSRVFIEGSTRSILDEAGRPRGYLVVGQDVTARVAFEERQRTLIDELNHRVKNNLALVQSLALRTFRGRGCDGALHEFVDRLIALAGAHELLTRNRWVDAELHEVVDGSLRGLGIPSERVQIAGPPVRLYADIAVNLSLALHELATNALKHGALSNDGGAVDLKWSLAGESQTVTLLWREHGGPLVAPPTRRGFGTQLLSRIFNSVGGRAETIFRPEGLECSIEFTPYLSQGELSPPKI